MDDRLEHMVRQNVREEIARQTSTSSPVRLPNQQEMAAAVRAELARTGRRPSELREVLGVSRPTIPGRLSGAYAFKPAELEMVDEFLSISVDDIFASAEVSQRRAAAIAKPVDHASASSSDPWAQPPGSSRRRRYPVD